MATSSGLRERLAHEARAPLAPDAQAVVEPQLGMDPRGHACLATGRGWSR
jgi:hypothetical protein